MKTSEVMLSMVATAIMTVRAGNYSYYPYWNCQDLTSSPLLELLSGLNLTYDSKEICCKELSKKGVGRQCKTTLSNCTVKDDIWARTCKNIVSNETLCSGNLGSDIFANKSHCCDHYHGGCGETDCFIPDDTNHGTVPPACIHITNDVHSCSSGTNPRAKQTLEDCLKSNYGYTYSAGAPPDEESLCWVPDFYSPGVLQGCVKNTSGQVCNRIDQNANVYLNKSKCCTTNFGWDCTITKEEFENDWDSKCWKKVNNLYCLEFNELDQCSQGVYSDIPLDIYQRYRTKEECCKNETACLAAEPINECFLPGISENFDDMRMCQKSYDFEQCEVVNKGEFFGGLTYDECCHMDKGTPWWFTFYCSDTTVDPGADPKPDPDTLTYCDLQGEHGWVYCEDEDKFCDSANNKAGVCKSLIKCDHSQNVFVRKIPIVFFNGAEYDLNGEWEKLTQNHTQKFMYRSKKNPDFMIGTKKVNFVYGSDTWHTVYVLAYVDPSSDVISSILNGIIPIESKYYEIMQAGIQWNYPVGSNFTKCLSTSCNGFSVVIDNAEFAINCLHYQDDPYNILPYIE